MTMQIDFINVASARSWLQSVATAMLATILAFIISIGAALLVPYYTTPTHGLIVALLPEPSLRNVANVVLLLLVPNLVTAFCWSFVALWLARCLVRPADLRLSALIAASIAVLWALASPFAFPKAAHVLIAIWMPGEVAAYMMLGGRYHTGDRSRRLSQTIMAGLVLVGVVENLALPPLMLHQYFDPATGFVMEPLKPDPRLPHYHQVEPPYRPAN